MPSIFLKIPDMFQCTYKYSQLNTVNKQRKSAKLERYSVGMSPLKLYKNLQKAGHFLPAFGKISPATVSKLF